MNLSARFKYLLTKEKILCSYKSSLKATDVVGIGIVSAEYYDIMKTYNGFPKNKLSDVDKMLISAIFINIFLLFL